MALAVDLVPELDGDQSYPLAARAAAAATDLPVVVLANMPARSIRRRRPRCASEGIPVLEGMRTGLLALRHLLDHAARGPRRLRAAPAAASRACRDPLGRTRP